MASLNEIVEGIRSDDPKVKLLFVKTARQMMTREVNPLINEFLDAGIVTCLANLLPMGEHIDLQLEAACALKAITSDPLGSTAVVTDADAVPHLVKLLNSPSLELCVQVVSALGNIAGAETGAGTTKLRDHVITCEIVDPLLGLLAKITSVTDVVLGSVLPVLSIMLDNNSQIIRGDVLCILAGIAKSWGTIQAIFNAKLFPLIKVALNNREDLECGVQAVGVVSNIATYGNHQQLGQLVSEGILQSVCQMLEAQDPGTISAALNSINIMIHKTDCPEAVHNVLAVIEGYGDVVQTIALMRYHGDDGVKDAAKKLCKDHFPDKYLRAILEENDSVCGVQAAGVVFNTAAFGDHQQPGQLARKGSLTSVCRMLEAQDPGTILAAFKSVNNMVHKTNCPEAVHKVFAVIERLGVVQTIALLRDHGNKGVKRAAKDFCKTHFSEIYLTKMLEEISDDERDEVKEKEVPKTRREE